MLLLDKEKFLSSPLTARQQQQQSQWKEKLKEKVMIKPQLRRR